MLKSKMESAAPKHLVGKLTSHPGGKLKANLKSGFDSDGEAADVLEADDKPAQPLETSMNQYETPHKRGMGEVIAENMPIKLKDSVLGGGARQPPMQGVQGEETSSEISRFMDDFYAKRGFFGPGG